MWSLINPVETGSFQTYKQTGKQTDAVKDIHKKNRKINMKAGRQIDKQTGSDTYKHAERLMDSLGRQPFRQADKDICLTIYHEPMMDMKSPFTREYLK